jgi:hypothetical protein
MSQANEHEDEHYEAVWVDKVEVAQRQIKETVRMFFGERDPVAIHTLIASAHQILTDIGEKRGAKGAFALKSVQRLNYPSNFLKHADRDPDAKINIGPMLRFSGDFIMDAILLLQQIASDTPMEAKVFWTWFVSKYPQEFADLPEGSEIKRLQEHKLADWDFRRISYFLEFADIVKGANLSEEPRRDTKGESREH